jgi:hypothetical protein
MYENLAINEMISQLNLTKLVLDEELTLHFIEG